MTHLSTLHGQNIESWTVELGIYRRLKRVNFHYRPIRKYLLVVKEFGRRQISCSCSYSIIRQAVPRRTRLGKYGGCLTLRSPVVTICTTRFNIEKSYILPHIVLFMYVLCVDLRTNCDYFPLQRCPSVFFLNRDGECLLRGTSQWAFSAILVYILKG
jgi:hypothetical protein